jgi:hypothetical protein
MSMQIILFARDGAGNHIRDAVTRTVPQAEIFSAMGNLVSRIRSPSLEPVIVVLIAASRNEFADILQLKWLLYDICTILILPDRSMETVAAGQILHPQFMGCLDDSPDEIAAVLAKMLTRGKLATSRGL